MPTFATQSGTTDGTKFLRDDGTWQNIPTSEGLIFSSLEKDLGAKAVKSGVFDVAGFLGLTLNKQLLVNQAIAVYTGKGTLKDEIELNQSAASGYVLNSTTIRINWICHWGMSLKGNVKFNFAISG